MDVKSLSKDDLYLLMESYRNMITMNATLAEQQKQLIENQGKLLDRQDTLNSKQVQLFDKISTLVDKIDEWTDVTKSGHDEIQNTCTDLESVMAGKLDKIADRTTDLNIENTKQHEGIKNHIYAAYIGLVGTVGSVVALIYFVFAHNDKADQLLKILIKISQAMNIQLS
jgi:hypothetical protein